VVGMQRRTNVYLSFWVASCSNHAFDDRRISLFISHLRKVGLKWRGFVVAILVMTSPLTGFPNDFTISIKFPLVANKPLNVK
jgi:hypothetical protein